MEKQIINKVNKAVNSKFPETKGVEPKIKKQSIAKGSPQKLDTSKNYLFTYQIKAKTVSNKTIKKYVRAVVSETGKIIKISVSK